MSFGGNNSMSSISSGTSTTFSFNRIVKDFKKSLGERKTPRNLVFLNRIMLLILLAMLILSSVEYSSLSQDITTI